MFEQNLDETILCQRLSGSVSKITLLEDNKALLISFPYQHVGFEVNILGTDDFYHYILWVWVIVYFHGLSL